MAAEDTFSEASKETGSSFRKTRYYLDSCASRNADTTGQNHKGTVSHDNYDCYRNQPSPSDAAADCVVGIRPGGFRFTSREVCFMKKCTKDKMDSEQDS
jgi:hypothetical protein